MTTTETIPEGWRVGSYPIWMGDRAAWGKAEGIIREPFAVCADHGYVTHLPTGLRLPLRIANVRHAAAFADTIRDWLPWERVTRASLATMPTRDQRRLKRRLDCLAREFGGVAE